MIYIKVLTNENNEPKIYVQIRDVAYLKENNIKMPDSIIKKVFSKDDTVINNSNLLSYIGFTDEAEIDFFNNQNFIIDLNEYQNLSLKEIEKSANQLVELINKINDKYNNLNTRKRKVDKNMKEIYNLLLYKLDSITYIYSLRRKETKSSFMTTDKVDALKKLIIKS